MCPFLALFCHDLKARVVRRPAYRPHVLPAEAEEGNTALRRRSLSGTTNGVIVSVATRAAIAAIALIAGLKGTQNAIANGETRSLLLYHAHTQESLKITFRRDGAYDQDALKKLNWFLRDWRKDEPIAMAPNLFDVLWHVYRESGASEPVKVVSAYRAPDTNAMLRRRSRAVAQDSHHTRGNAMDVHIPGVSMGKIREFAMRLQAGGVGYYPSAGSPFVHIDVGNVRSWPRMGREQLERLFPDGKTVHLPADGKPLANYQLALADVQARGGRALDFNTVTTTRGPSLWALLFGGGDDEDKAEVGRQGRQTAARGNSRGQSAQTEIAPPSNTDDRASLMPQIGGATLAFRQDAPSASPTIARPVIAEKPVEIEPPKLEAAAPLPPVRPKGFGISEAFIATDGLLPPVRIAGLRPFAAAPPTTSAQSPAESPVPASLASTTPQVAAPDPILPPLRSNRALAPSTTALAVSEASDGILPPSRNSSSRALDSVQNTRSQPEIAPKGLPPIAVRREIAPEAKKALTDLINDQGLRNTRPGHVVNVRETGVAGERKREIIASGLLAPKESSAPDAAFSGTFIRPLGNRFTRDAED